MKKIMMTLAAVVCCAMISTVFTSCSKDDSDSSNLYYYRANGDITGTGGFGGLFVITDYTTAIESVVGDGFTNQEDQKVIQACDAVYAKHKAEYGTTVSGTVVINRHKLGDDNDVKVIKEYKY